jgi:hypothetical protein
VLGALGKDQFALGKGFAKCHTRQSALEKKFVAKGALPSVIYQELGKYFIECRFDTRQRKVVVTAMEEVTVGLPSAMGMALGKLTHFAECHAHDTRQTCSLC